MTGTPTAIAPSSWRAIGASVIGAAHLAQGRPNEDAFATRSHPEVAVAAVADGHGSSRCPRAATGARLAVDIVADLLEDAGRRATDPGQLRSTLTTDVGPHLVERWRRAVADDAAADPFTAAELEAVGAAAGGIEAAATWLAYGCTLVATVATSDLLGVFQIGDGDCVLVDHHGGVSRPLPDDPTNRGNVTSSLSQSDPLQALRCAAVDLHSRPQLLAFVSSDGFGGAYTERDWWEEVGGDLADRATRLSVDELEQRLPEWLAEPAKVGGDDSTMALLVTGPAPARTAVLAPDADTLEPPAPAPAPERAAPAAPAEAPPARRGWLVLLAVLVAIAAAAAVWFVAGPSDGSDEAPPQVPVEQGPDQAPTTGPAAGGSGDANDGVSSLDGDAGG